MTKAPPLFFPLFAPPAKNASDPATYYAGLGTTTNVAPTGDGGMVITFTNPLMEHPNNHFDTPIPMLSTVFAPTRGLLSFYPSANALPTPDGLPITLPSGVLQPDAGSLVLEIWAADYRKLGTTVGPDEVRPTHLVLGGVDSYEVEVALAVHVSGLKRKALRKSYGGGTQTVTDEELREAHLARVMAGTAKLYVPAGARLGATVTFPDPSNLSLPIGWLLWRSFAARPQAAPLDTAALEVIDDIVERSRSSNGASVYQDHPLAAVASAKRSVTFQCAMKVWNNQTYTYVPFANGQVKLITGPGTVVATTSTDQNGVVNFTAQMSPGDEVVFEYAITGRTYGDRIFDEPIQTEAEKLGRRLGANDTITTSYYARYGVYAHYRAFWSDLRSHTDTEKYDRDRGNSNEGIEAIAVREGRFLARLHQAELKYSAGPPSKPQFNVLFEGDSWLFYPMSKDIFDWMDKLIEAKLDKTYQYNCFPLQHFGDRSDQMFVQDPVAAQLPSGWRQWKFTTAFLSDFPIDVIVLSAGGNDIAEPGISSYEEDRNYFSGAFIDAPDGSKNTDDPKHAGEPRVVFDPNKLSTLTPAKQVVAKRLMDRSFAILLRNHPWNIFKRNNSAVGSSPGLVQKTGAELDAAYHAVFPTLDNAFGTSALKRETIAGLVLKDFHETGYPYKISTPHEYLLDQIFDTDEMIKRFDSIRKNLEILAAFASANAKPIIIQSCSYPFFNEKPTYLFDNKNIPIRKGPLRGPWFRDRFTEANIRDYRIKAIALKALIDIYFVSVLEPIHGLYQTTFHFVDVRTEAYYEDYWRDEMHLFDRGFERIALKMYGKLQEKFKTKLSV